jgi:hypothetical protein
MDFVRQYRIDIVVLIFCLGASFFLYRKSIPTDYFGYDEADYMYAASKGLCANYIDRDAIPFATFIEQGLNKGLKKEKRASLSEFLRGSDDITFYRHYHGPLYFYFLSLTYGLSGKSEFLMRWSSLLFWIASVAITYMGCLFLLGKAGRRSAVLAAAFLLFSTTNIKTCTQVTPHGLYVLTVIISLLLISKFLKTKQLIFLYCATVTTAFAFLTIEYALLLLLTFISCVWLQRKQTFTDLSLKDLWFRAVFIPAGLLVGTVFVLWPAAWLKMSLLKNYIFFAYFTLIRGGEYGAQPFWQVWLSRFWHSPVEYMLVVPATGIALFKLKRHKWYLPFLIYPFLVFISTFRNTSTSPTYISSLLPPLYILSGIVIADLLGTVSTRKRTFAGIFIVLGLLGSFFFRHYFGISREKPEQNLKEVVKFVEKNELHNGKTLVDREFIPTLHYYFPAKSLPSYRKGDETFDTIITKLRVNSYTGVIFSANGDRVAFEKWLQRHFVFNANFIASYNDSNIIHYKLKPVK